MGTRNLSRVSLEVCDIGRAITGGVPVTLGVLDNKKKVVLTRIWVPGATCLIQKFHHERFKVRFSTACYEFPTFTRLVSMHNQ
mmetsp:Transcript_24781/g.60881  ORF Transcript_24781/g.60881 Transcript_24781/m.60881 type:complete len:83 (-) Transcript_24781:1328-1576(-)